MAGVRSIEPARVGPWTRRVEVAAGGAAEVLRDPCQGDLYAELGLPAVEMPAGFAIEGRVDGLHLVREGDGADLGVMANEVVAAKFAGAVGRMGRL